MEDKIITISEQELRNLINQAVERVTNELSKNSNSEDSSAAIHMLMIGMLGTAIRAAFMVKINEYYEKQQEPNCEVVFNENN